MMAKSLRERLMDEFKEYMSLPMTNWRVNNVMEWWSDNEEKFPNIAKLARKYLAIPASSAPSERVFSQMKIIVERKRWRMDPERLESVLFFALQQRFTVVCGHTFCGH